MTPDAVRRQARAFLRKRQMLSAAEADQALDVAATVLAAALDHLAAAAAADDGPACAETAHGLKGNLLNLGLPELATVAQDILDKAREGSYQFVLTGREKLATSLATLLARSGN